MVAFASPSELGLDSGEEFDHPRALAKLQSATNAIIAEIGWDPRQSARTFTARGVYYGSLFLPALNVTALSLTADAVAVPVASYDWDEAGHVFLRLPKASVVVITYTAGFSPLPSVFKEICVEEAARRLSADLLGPLRSRSWTIGAESQTDTYAGSGADSGSSGSLLATDVRLNPYRLTAVVA